MKQRNFMSILSKPFDKYVADFAFETFFRFLMRCNMVKRVLIAVGINVIGLGI